MAWANPRTSVTGEIHTAAMLNQTRDNLNELVVQEANVDTAETTTSSSFTDLTTTGPAVTVDTGDRTSVYVLMGARFSCDTAGGVLAIGVAVSGASTIAAATARSVQFESSAANDVSQHNNGWRITGLTAGSNTFTAKYLTTAGTANFQRRRLALMVG